MGPPKILIVEDEPIEALDLASILSRLGYQVTGSVLSGEECLAMAAADPPDLVVMDIKLEGEMDGIDTAWELRKICQAPVVFATAMSDRSSLARAKVAEPYGYILKPYSERELYTTIETSLYKHRVDSRLRESEARYRGLFEGSRDAIFMHGAEGMINEVNRAMSELTGYDDQALIGMKLTDLFSDGAEGRAVLDEMGARDMIEDREVLVRKRDGSEANCLLSSTRITGPGGEDFGLQGILRDVTGQKRLERVRDALFHEKIKRVKELNCLYRIAEISSGIETGLDEIFRRIVDAVPSAFQDPRSVSVFLSLGEVEYRSSRFKESETAVSSTVRVFGSEEGTLFVYGVGRQRGDREERFSREDRDLINAVTERIGIIIERNRTFRDLTHSREELRGLSSHLQSLREEERTAIAREIHDALGQTLTAMKMDLSWIKNRLPKESEGLAERAGAMLLLIDGAVDTVRRISSELRPDLLDNIGLGAAIEWHAEEFQKRTGIPCRLVNEIGELDIEERKSINIFRIFQESLTNIIRHAGATAVDVVLRNSGNALTLIVSDNGRGITDGEMRDPRSLGLIGARERALSCGGSIEIRGEEGRGTVLSVTMPIGGYA